ncbi:MAG TPA: endonuclease III [Armatimonadota bacterium]
MPSNEITRVLEIIRILKENYPEARVSLDHKSPFQLLIATILAAQSTDKKINEITPALFKKYPTPEAFATSDPAELEQDIHASGFFRQKARSIIEASQDIVNEFGGELPDSMEGLVSLRGVGRKTANVVLGAAFNKPAMIVDTHVLRIAGRLALVDPILSEKKEAEKVEAALMKIVPEEDWTQFSNILVHFGRDICNAKKPRHEQCPILHLCPTGKAALNIIE